MSQPEISREEMRNHYDFERERAVKKGREPIINAMFAILQHRYTLRRIFISDPVHHAEIAPFAMMDEQDGKERLIDYLMAREGRSEATIMDVKIAINRAFRNPVGVNAVRAYDALLLMLPFTRFAATWWFDWLDDDVRVALLSDAKRRNDEIARHVDQNTAPFLVLGISQSSSVTASTGEALFGCGSARDAIKECARLHGRGIRSFVIKDPARQTVTMDELFSAAQLSRDDPAFGHLLP